MLLGSGIAPITMLPPEMAPELGAVASPPLAPKSKADPGAMVAPMMTFRVPAILGPTATPRKSRQARINHDQDRSAHNGLLPPA